MPEAQRPFARKPCLNAGRGRLGIVVGAIKTFESWGVGGQHTQIKIEIMGGGCRTQTTVFVLPPTTTLPPPAPVCVISVNKTLRKMLRGQMLRRLCDFATSWIHRVSCDKRVALLTATD